MARITKDFIEAQAAATLGARLPAERAAAIAEAVQTLIRATDEASAAVALESEPARFLTAIDETAER